MVGPLIGLVIVALFWVTNRPLGALGGYIDSRTGHGSRARSSAGARALVFGVVLGGFAFAVATGSIHPTADYGGFVAHLSLMLRVVVLVGADS